MKIPTEVRLCWDFFRGCTCLKCTNRPEVHQPRRNAPFTLLVQQRLLHPLEVHQPRRNAPFTLLVQQRLLHPLEGTNRASTAPTALTIRGYVGVRGYGRDAIPSCNCSP